MAFDPISYKKAQRAEELAEQIVDGEVDKGVLRTEIDRKLGVLEEEYAPKLNSVRQDLESRGINVDSFDIIAPEMGEEGRINRAIEFAVSSGLSIVYLPGKTRDIRGTVNVKEGITFLAVNNKFVNNSGNHITFIRAESKTRIFGVEIEGAGHETLNRLGRGIEILGENADNRVEDILINDVYVHDLGMYGIYTEFAKDVYVGHVKMKNLGYAGFMNISPVNVHIEKSIIKGITGDGLHGYGVAFTRNGGDDLFSNPRALDCSAKWVIVEDNPTWEGLDTHAGENVSFLHCTTRNCKVGIAIVPSHVGGDDDYAPLNFLVENNLVLGNHTGIGINISGAHGSIGSPKERATGKVLNNRVFNSGQAGNNISGGIVSLATDGIEIINNIVTNPSPHGIVLYHSNRDASAQGNIVIDPNDSTVPNVSGIVIRSNYNTGIIANNETIKNNGELNTYVGVNGLSNQSSNEGLDITLSNNRSTCATPLSGIRAPQFTYQLGSVNFFDGVNSPEGVVSAKVGSYYVNNNGGISKTVYIKSTGTGAFGWNALHTIRAVGTTGRPAGLEVGAMIFDTTLGKPVWHKGNNVWVDASGTTV